MVRLIAPIHSEGKRPTMLGTRRLARMGTLAEAGRFASVRSASGLDLCPRRTRFGAAAATAAAAAAAAAVLGFELRKRIGVHSDSAARAQAQGLTYTRSEVVSAAPTEEAQNPVHLRHNTSPPPPKNTLAPNMLPPPPTTLLHAVTDHPQLSPAGIALAAAPPCNRPAPKRGIG